MLKKILMSSSMILLMSQSLTSHAAESYKVAICKDQNNQPAMYYVCFSNSSWPTSFWVPQSVDSEPGSSPSDACVQDTGGVFYSSKTILESCKAFGGTHVIYNFTPNL